MSYLSYVASFVIIATCYAITLFFSRFVFAQVTGASVMFICVLAHLSYYLASIGISWLISLVTLQQTYSIHASFISLNTFYSLLITSVITSVIYVVLKKSFKQTSGLFIS
ncbi:hypothetical protein IT409_02950 [Candidatus Falkowbacteria bacterium]|nr:hypothetical protein [Candidatus Falkowbacteria bacterium]